MEAVCNRLFYFYFTSFYFIVLVVVWGHVHAMARTQLCGIGSLQSLYVGSKDQSQTINHVGKDPFAKKPPYWPNKLFFKKFSSEAGETAWLLRD